MSETADENAPVPAPAPAPLLPALAIRVDDLVAAIASLSSRVDGVAAMAQTLQTSVTDRFVEFVETTTAATTAQGDALDEYRRATERSVGELRRASATNDDLIRTLLARIDELTTDLRDAISSVPEPALAPEPADVDLDAITAAVTDAMAPALVALAALPEKTPEPPRPPRTDKKVTDELEAIREQMTELKRRVGVRARTKATLDDADVDRLAEAVVARLTEMLEVVPDDEPAPVASTPPPPAPAPRRQRRTQG